MHRLFVDGRLLSATDFNQFWPQVDPVKPPPGVTEPFIQILSDKGLVPLEKSLKLISEKSRLAFLPLEKYDVDADLARSFPRDVCLRWCVLPFDRMSKSILVASANPFNKQAVWELESSTKSRLLFYLCPPGDLIRMIKKLFR
jgi:hypothetical protein